MAKFFGAIRERLERIKQLDENALFNEILIQKEVQHFILELNRSGQLWQGLDAMGLELDGYSPFTENLLEGDRANRFSYEGKSKSKRAGEPVFFFDTGEFYESFSIKIEKTRFFIVADTVKETQDLLNFGEILGLSDESMEKVIEVFRAKLLPLVRAHVLQ